MLPLCRNELSMKLTSMQWPRVWAISCFGHKLKTLCVSCAFIWSVKCSYSISFMKLQEKILINTLRPRQTGRHFPDDIFKWIFLNENVWISINISLKFVPRGSINNIPTLVQVMALRRPDDKPLSEPMMVYLLTHICVTRPQWVKDVQNLAFYITTARAYPVYC